MQKYLQKWRTYFLYGGFISFFINLLALTFTVYMLLIFDRVLTSYSVPTLVVITCLAAAATIAGVGLDVVRSKLLVRLGIQIDLDLSEKVFKTMMREISRTPGAQATAGLRDVSMLRQYCSGSAIYSYFDLPMTPICIILIFVLHPYLGYVAVAGGAITLGLGILAERMTRRTLDTATELNMRGSHLVAQATRNAEAVASMGMLPGIAAKWNAMNILVMNLQTMASHKAGVLQACIKGLRMFMQIAIYGTGAYLAVTGKGTAGIMLAASVAMGKALGPIDSGVATYKQTLEALAAYKRLNAMFTHPEEPQRMELPAPQGDIRCEGVIYAAQGRALLQGVTFQLTAGQSMGLIGPSAAGKSTLCRLITGIWPALRGTVWLDGVDIQSWDQDKLGAHLGYLPQDVELFSGTVAENIARLGEVDSEKVIAAAQMSGAHEMILRLPAGYDTEIGAGGAALSGGQRQRIGLARALYDQPKILVLDEPSSNLDDEGERAILQALEQLKRIGVTTIIVSHKPSTIANVDMVLVLKEGQGVMFGPREAVFRELMGAAPQVPLAQPVAYQPA